MNDDVGEFLAHYGVKGMRWGRRKAEGSGSGNSGGSAKKEKFTESRREYKKRTKSEAKEFQQKKLERTVKTASEKGDNVLIKTMYADGTPTIVSGREFVRDISSGRMFNAKVTDVVAEKRADGVYYSADIEKYTKSRRR